MLKRTRAGHCRQARSSANTTASAPLQRCHIGHRRCVNPASTPHSAHRAPRVPQVLQALDAVIYSTVQGDARWHFTGPGGKAESVVVRGALRSNNLSSLLLAASEGFGVAALPRYAAQEALKSGALTTVLNKWQLPQQEIHAVYPSPRVVTAKVTMFIGWLQQHLTEGWWAAVGARGSGSSGG